MVSYSDLTDFQNLYNAHISCRRGKRWKDSVAIFDVRAYECTHALKRLLESGEYRLSPYNCFTISERGKKRDIKSIRYHDRVVQKCLMDNILTPIVEPTFINTNSASQKGKGTDYALAKLKEHMRQCYRRHRDGYILICDMHHYFDTIPHEYLNEFYRKKLEDKQLIDLIEHIHASIPGGRGVPLGNQLSQLDALIMLSKMDHIIKEQKHIKWYGRYNDDFYLIDSNIDKLRECREWIREYTKAYGMTLNKKKTRIVKISQGIEFLGFKFYVTDTGKVVQKLAKKSIKHHKRKLRKMKKMLDEGKVSYQACKEAHEGWKAHALRNKKKKGQARYKARPDTYYLARKMDKYFEELFKNVKEAENGKTIKPAPSRSNHQGCKNKI